MAFLAIDGVINARYLPGPPLGKGGFSEVYEVIDSKSPLDKVALKVTSLLNNEEAKSFCEIEKHILKMSTLSGMNHFPKFLDAFEYNGFFCLIIGKETDSLRRVRMRNNTRKFSPPNIMKMFVEITKGLAHLNELGFIHRDLHESNVLVANVIKPGSTVRISDFGTAGRIVDESGEKIIPGIGNFSFALAKWSSLDVNLFKTPDVLDDYVSMLYLIFSLHGYNDFMDGSFASVVEKKKEFHEDPSEYVKKCSWMREPADYINSSRGDSNFDPYELIEKIKKSYYFDEEDAVTHKKTPDGLIIY